MKEFFEQCLNDLESLTGIRQLAYLEMEAKNDENEARRKINICIDGMVLTSKQFDYIPEDDQKKIIKAMITKDQDYDALNSRTIFKWLNMYKEHFFSVNKAEEVAPQIIYKPGEKERIDAMLTEHLKTLSGSFTPQYARLDDEMNKIKREDEERLSGRKAVAWPSSTAEELILKQLHIEWSREYHDLHTGKPKENWISFDEFLKLE